MKRIRLMTALLALLLTGCSYGNTTAQSTDNLEEASAIGTEASSASKEDIAGEAATTEEEDMGNVIRIPDNEAIDFVQNLKIGYNLGNTFDSYSEKKTVAEPEMETLWGNPETTREFIVALHESGFETIRIPVSWHNHVDEDLNINEEWLSRVQEVVDYAYEEGMYVILNIHHDNHLEANGFYPDKDHEEQSLNYIEKIWTQLSDRFKDYDEKLIFESLNEPRLVGHTNEWWIDMNSQDCLDAISIINEMNQKFVDVVRASGGYNSERYLLCPGYCASPKGILNDNFVIPTDTVENRIILSVHSYLPHSFALESDGTDSFNPESYVDTKDINDYFEKIYNKYISQGIPVIIGECGCVDKDNLEARVDWADYFSAKAKEYGMTFCWWDNGLFSGDGEKFGLMNRETGEVVFPEILEAMLNNCIE